MSSTYIMATMNKACGFLGLGFPSQVGKIIPASEGCEDEVSEGLMGAL